MCLWWKLDVFCDVCSLRMLFLFFGVWDHLKLSGGGDVGRFLGRGRGERVVYLNTGVFTDSLISR